MKTKIFLIIIAFAFYLTPYAQENSCSELIGSCGESILNMANEVLSDVDCIQWKGRCGVHTPIYREGKVAIGTASFPESPLYNLAVKYGILSDRLKLCKGGGWCDYVFEKDYDLMPLNELKTFIQTNKHLPNTPSAREIMDDGGFLVTDVMINHQEKIEEAFLYLFELEKELQQLERKEVLSKNDTF